MTKFEIYSLILCIVVFVMLVSLFSYMLTMLIKQTLKHIKAGLDDEEILKEFNNANKNQGKFSKAVNIILSALLGILFSAFFLSSVYINCTQNVYFENMPTYRVVLTSSMEEKNQKNTYLFDNNLNNQIGVFDLIATYKLPKEEELQLYDIVVYEVDGILVVHRIVGIEEPNEKHPNERHFLMQGDAVGSPDRFPVLYSQMKGIYKGEKIAYIGSFVLFMQSPAGWICIFLVFIAIVLTPILEKKLSKARKDRYSILTTKQEITESQPEEELVVSKFAGVQRSDKTFFERHTLSSSDMQERYKTIVETLLRIDGIRVIESKKQHSYKCKSICVARLFFRGKTLNVCLGLDPKDYENSKYVFTDVSKSIKHKNYPMRLKLSSERQTRWTCDLILELANEFGLKILEKPMAKVEKVSPFAHLKGKRNRHTFKERLEKNQIAKHRFEVINESIMSIDGIRVIEGKHNITYKHKNKAIAKITVKGKTLNVYLGANPDEYKDSKYIFTNVSLVKKYANYPMRLKVSSERQTRWTSHLIKELADKHQLTLIEKPIKLEQEKSPFAHLKGKVKTKTLKKRIKENPIAKQRFDIINEFITAKQGVRIIEGKYSITYKLKNIAIAKIAIKGKTLNIYLGLNPSEYKDSKYIFTDVSKVKKYANYPMRVRASSDRQVKWIKELISQIIK